MQLVRFCAGALFLAAGLLTCIIGVIGVFKFKYAANRMHSAAVNDTLGISLCMIGLAIMAPDIASALKLLLVVVFFWISAPVASHLLCRLELETNENRAEYMELHVIEGKEKAEPAAVTISEEASVPADGNVPEEVTPASEMAPEGVVPEVETASDETDVSDPETEDAGSEELAADGVPSESVAELPDADSAGKGGAV
ncbi:MAG: monovalent cation/H(+) antiporter subunit G [Clostridia bacterium]|nr:monovalent cation/H(+) antiporter subunit G [Clostridia bacterium]